MVLTEISYNCDLAGCNILAKCHIPAFRRCVEGTDKASTQTTKQKRIRGSIMKMQNDKKEFVSAYLAERERYESREGLGYSIGHTMSLPTPPPSQPGLQTSTGLTMGPLSTDRHRLS